MFRSERPGFQRQSSAERALARANQRLQKKGSVHRDDSSDNEDDINNYLSSLRKKTSMGAEKQTNRLSLGDGASDISITDSSDTSMEKKKPQSKFLKSKAPAPAPVSSQPSFSASRPSAIGTDAIHRSAALAKASSLTGRLGRWRGLPEKAERSSSESQTSPEMLYAKSSRAKLNYLTDEESASIGRDGSKFLRKKEKNEDAAEFTQKSERKGEGNLTPKTRKHLRFVGLSDDDDGEEIKEVGTKSPKTPSSHSSSINSGRLRRSLTISDEDMSTAELGEGIISSSSGPETPKKPALKSPSTPTSPKKRVTIAEATQDISEASDLSFLEDNIVERLGGSDSTSSSSSSEKENEVEELSESTSSHNDQIVENVMDVGDLESDDSSSSRPRLEAIQSIDDLSSVSAVSEDRIRSSPSSPSSSTSTSATVIQSEARGVSQYDSDFEASEIVSEKTRPTAPTLTYSQDFESPTQSSTSRADYSSESEETTVTESYTKRVHRRRRKSNRDEDKSVQTVDAGLSYQWHMREAGQPYVGDALGMAAVDLNPIAHYVVPPESLEGVTAYNPCVVALNNLLRQQLQMTQNFMATQRRLYDAMSRTITPEHSYTTLEETKKFIAKNRPATISMEDALREVEQEMN